MSEVKVRCDAYKKLENAHEKNQKMLILDSHNQNKFHLCRFRKTKNVRCTGKDLGDKYAVVFWDTLIKSEGE